MTPRLRWSNQPVLLLLGTYGSSSQLSSKGRALRYTHTYTETIDQYISECDLNFRVSISRGCWGSTGSNQRGLPRGKDLNSWEWEGGNLSLTPNGPQTGVDTTLLCRSRCCSVAQSCPTLCNPMNCSTPGFPVPQYLLVFACPLS